MNIKNTSLALGALALVLLLSIYLGRNSLLVSKHEPSPIGSSSEKLLPPQIKRAVNQALAPAGATYPKTENAQGITIDVSQKAASVSTAVIDEKGQLHIVDYTSPIKE